MTVYKAFISYSHAADGKLAPSLQKALGRFGRAWYQRAAFRIFRDETNLSLNPGLWTSIEKALSESEYFLLLCSPDAAQSKWVSREVDYWIRHSSSQKLLLVLTDGQVIWDPATADFDWSQTTLPQNLSKAYPEEPLYMDLRWARTAENLSLMKPRFRDQIADILATLTDRPKDELIGEDVRVQRKARRLAWFISLLLSALTVIAVTAAIWAFHERELAQEQTKLALARQLAARSELLRIQNPDLLERSTLLSIHAIKRLHSIETDQALRSNLEILPRRLVLLKHTQPVTMLALSHDGEYLFNSDPPYLVTASGGPFPYWLDRSVGIWELPPSTEHVRLAQSAGANSVVFSPDGRMVATSSDDGNVRLFKVPSGELLTTINHVDAVTDIAFGPGGKWLAAASDRRIFPEPQDDLVRVWDVSQHIESLRIPHVDLVRSIAVSPDGQYLATGGGGGVMPKTKDHSVHIWEMPGGRPVATIPATSDVLKVGFSPDGKLGASIERTGILTLWRPESGVEVTRHNLGIQAQGFAFDHSGRRLAVATHDSARVYDIRNLHELQRIPHESFVNAVAFSPDDRYLASGDSGKSARIWDLDENREVARFYHDEIVSSVAFSPDPDGRLLATASFGKTAHLWLWRKEDLVAEACTRLTRDLNKQEWHQYLGSELQYPTCNHIP